MKLIAAIATAILLACPAYAQSNCAPSAQAIEALSGRYGEIVIEAAEAYAPGTDVMVQWHIWLNPETGTWSFTGTANGITCLFDSGNEYNGQDIGDFLDWEPA